MKLGYIAIDQYGETVKLTNADKHPVGQLLKSLHRRHAKKMYIDGLDGKARHKGYVIGNRWFSIFEIHSWEGGK